MIVIGVYCIYIMKSSPEEEVWQVKAIVNDTTKADRGAGSHVQLTLSRYRDGGHC